MQGKIFILFFLAVAFISLLPSAVFAVDGAITGYAWSSQFGWVNFGTTNGNAYMTDSVLTGYAWNENTGRIFLSPTNGGVLNDANGTLSGKAWDEGTGWIDFTGVVVNSLGVFHGTAAGDNNVDINFDCTHCNVTTDWRPNTLPVASSVSIDSGATEINLIEGTTKNVVCTAVVTDVNGYADITSVQAKFYRTGVGAGAANNNTNHYTRTGDAQCIPSGGTGTTENYTCTFAVYFYADATDTGSPHAADDWTCQVTPTDTVGVGTPATDTIEMNSLSASTVTLTIAYGALALGADTSTVDQTTIVTNTGNRQIDVQLDGYAATTNDGYAMACVIAKVVVGNERYNTSASTAWSSKTPLSGTPATLSSFDLLPGPASTKNIYWGLGLPASGVGGACTGKVNFTPVNG